MKTRFKIKYLFMFMTALLSLAIFSFNAFAQEGAAIKLNYVVDNAEFKAYRVGAVNADGSFSLTDSFKGYGVALDNENAASTLAYYIQRDKLTPVMTAKTDSTKAASFNSLEKGIYIILGETKTTGNTTYRALPVMVSLTKDITINGKYEYESHSSSGGGGGGGGGGGSSVSYISLSALKVWQGEKGESVKVQLLKNGDVYDEQILNEDNNWRYTWTGLNKKHDWTVVEESVPKDCKVAIEKDGNVFVITNTRDSFVPDEPTPNDPSKPTDPINPNTPYDPSNPNVPYDPSNPNAPYDLSNPNVPYDPSNPSTPDAPNLGDVTGGGNGVIGSSTGGGNGVSGGGNNGSTSSVTEMLPQTGQPWTPVIVLAIGGILFLILGIGLKRNENEGNGNEA